MLPGFSSKNDQNCGGGKKKLKLKKHFDNDKSSNNEFNEILLQYNLERMNDQQQQYDFSHCDTHRDAYPFASSLSKNTDDDSLFEREGHHALSYLEDGDDEEDGQGSGDIVEIRICTYQINTSCHIPFLEYIMTLSHEKDGGNKVFEFPKFDYISSKRKSAEKQAEEHILKTVYH